LQQNYADAKLREVARGKVAASLQKAAAASAALAPTATALEAPKYRDRASERRVMHNQPEAPQLAPADPAKRKGRADGPPPPPSPPPPPVAPGKDEKNVGNRLLKMMGWTEGQGLGAEGEGRVDPV
jgi:RNA-binding protein 5/10